MVFPLNPKVGDVWREFGKEWMFDGFGWGAVSTTSLFTKLEQRLMSEIVNPQQDLNKQFRVTDAPGGEAVVYSDGTFYRRISDQSPVK